MKPSRYRAAPASRVSVRLGCALVALAPALTGCTPLNSNRPQGTPRTETLSVESSTGARGTFDVRTEAAVWTRGVDAGAASVWAVLPAVFETLGIPISTVDLDAFIMGNEGFSDRTIEDQRMSRYVDCGQRAGRSRADQYQVTMYVMVQLSPVADEATVVNTYFDAYARDRGVSGNAVHCVTTARLERRIMELINDAVGVAGAG